MISTKGRYAIRLMIDLAEHPQNTYIPLKDIAERQGISKKYLEIIVKDLVKAKLLCGASGKGGGYQLGRPAETISIGEILICMEGTLSCVHCLADPDYDCSRKDRCQTLSMWTDFDRTVHDFFFTRIA